MSTFSAVIVTKNLVREAHPSRYPVKPIRSKEDDDTGYAGRIALYQLRELAYQCQANELTYFNLVEMQCESGMVVPSNCLAMDAVCGHSCLVELLDSGDVRLLPSPVIKKGKH